MPRRLGGVPLGARSHSKMILGCFLQDFRLHLGSPEGHFWGHFGAGFANPSDYVDFVVIFFWSRKNERKRSSPRGGGHAIRSCRRMFREDRPLLPRLHFGLHFGVILGAKFATILLSGRRSRQQGPQVGTFFAMRFCIPFFMDFRCQGDLQEGCRRRGRRTSGNQVILHLGPWRMILPCVFEHSVQRPLQSPKDKSLK